MEVERIDDDKKDRRKWERDSERRDGIERKGKEQMRKREPTKRRGTTLQPLLGRPSYHEHGILIVVLIWGGEFET